MLHTPRGRVLLTSSSQRALVTAAFTGAAGAALPAIWTAQLGAFDLDGSGHARGKTLATDGIELLSNTEFTTNTTGWGTLNAGTLTRRDYAVSPALAPTGGADNYGLEVQNNGTSNGCAAQTITSVPGVTYAMSIRSYSPSTNTQVQAAYLISAGLANVTAEDVWQTLTLSEAAAAATKSFYPTCAGSTAGDLAHFDAASMQAKYAIATFDATLAAIELRVPVTLPASDVKPFGIIARYQDASNYWLWRITPGTAGADFELIEVNGGVMTQRASADVDWVASTTYNLTLRHSGANVYTALVNGVSKLSYTDGTAFLATSTLYGLQEASATNGLFGTVEVWPL